MIIKCTRKDEERILSYIGKDYPSCLYLYLDLKKYGIESETVEVYLQLNGDGISSVLLKYYSCLHLFSRDDSFDADEAAGFFRDGNFTMLYCARRTADRLYASFPDPLKARAAATNGWVAQIRAVDQEPRGLAVPAGKSDFAQIASLIFQDEDIGRSYRYDELSKQLEERSQEGYARNLVIRQNDIVIAHACTNAEMDAVAVVAELIVRKEFRGQGYASEIWRDLCNKLLSEGKEVYSFYFAEESRRLHKQIGFFEVCEWTKVVIT